MSKKAFIILVCLIIFFILFAQYNSKEMSKRSISVKTSLLEFEIDKVQSININSKDIILSFEKNNNEWLCKSKYNYNANKKKINELLINLRQLESYQQITSNLNYFSKLSVSGENATNILLQDKNNNLLSSISIGNIRNSVSSKYSEEAGQYVLPHLKKTCFLISNPINISKDTTDWLDNSLLNIKKQDIDTLSFKKSNPFKIINKDKESNIFHLESLKEGYKEKTWDIDQAAGIYENFSFNDLMPLKEYLSNPDKFEIILIINTFEGINYEISLFEENEKSLIKIHCTSEKESMNEKVKQLNTKFSNWIYELETWNSSYIKKSYDDFVEPIVKNESSNNNDTLISQAQNEQNEENHVEISPMKPELE